MRFRSCAGATLFLFVILLAHGVRGSGYPDRGTNAPPFGPITWINAPTPAGVDLRGKVVVLEFGATWCEVCRMSIPHLNDLSKRFGGDSVVFVLISNESPQVVAQFLTENSLHPAVGCDTTGETYDAYDIRRIPRTFLIDAYGVVSWYGHPNSITTDVLSRYLKSGDVPSIAFEADSLRIPELVQTAQPGFTLSVNHAQSGYRFGQQTETSSIEREESGRYVIEFKGRRLSEIISRLSREPVTRIRFNPELEFEPVFDLRLEVSTPMSFDAGRSKAIQIFCDALNLGIRESEALTPGLTMTISVPGFLDRADAPGSATRRDGNRWIGTGLTLGQLGEQLESLLGQIIWNDTSMDGEYDFDVPVSNFDSARKALQAKYGIALDTASRPVNLLILEPTER